MQSPFLLPLSLFFHRHLAGIQNRKNVKGMGEQLPRVTKARIMEPFCAPISDSVSHIPCRRSVKGQPERGRETATMSEASLTVRLSPPISRASRVPLARCLCRKSLQWVREGLLQWRLVFFLLTPLARGPQNNILEVPVEGALWLLK